MRTLFTLGLCALAVMMVACQDTPTGTSTIKVGKSSVEEMLAVPAYKAWYDPGYAAYPDAAHKGTFDSSVAVISQSFVPASHTVVMIVKPNCGCQITQLWMPRVMKALDAAGVPHANIEVYITDAHLSGLDTVERKYNVDVQAAPVFYVAKNNSIVTRIDPTLPSDLPASRQIEQMLAGGFVKP